MVDSVLLRPLPYPDAERLVAIWSLTHGQTEPRASSPPDFREFRAQASAFEGIGGYYSTAANLLVEGEPVRLIASRARVAMFSILGVPPLMGHPFLENEEVSGRDRVVLLSHAIWRDRFGGRQSIVGSSLTLDGAPHTVVGVMPPAFRFPDRNAEVWLPIAFAAGDVL